MPTYVVTAYCEKCAVNHPTAVELASGLHSPLVGNLNNHESAVTTGCFSLSGS